jgi:amino-acid N-acetyltransferase
MKEKITIGAARADEIVAISSLLAANRDDPGLFQESPAAIAEALEDFLVARTEQGETVGCAGLHRDTPELGEIYAVAVDPKRQGQGIGQQLMRACQEEASAKGILRLWLATIKPVYFERYGFQPISRWQLPASVLLRKLRMVFQQPAGRRLPALVGRHTFMCCDVSPEEGGHGFRVVAQVLETVQQQVTEAVQDKDVEAEKLQEKVEEIATEKVAKAVQKKAEEVQEQTKQPTQEKKDVL